MLDLRVRKNGKDTFRDGLERSNSGGWYWSGGSIFI